MIEIIISIIIGLVVGGLCVYFCLRGKLKTTQELDLDTQKRNEEIQEYNEELNKITSDLRIEHAEKKTEVSSLNYQIDALDKQLADKKQMYDELESSQIQLLQERLSNAADDLSRNLEQNREEYQEEYLATLQDCVSSFQSQIAFWANKLKSTKAEYDKFHKIVEAATAEYIRTYEEKEKEKFYQLILPEEDLEEIKKLREVAKYLRDSEPLNKVIWKVYYENPYTDMIGRVLGKQPHTGIYKITNLTNGMCYVGQAANVADRWKQHIKRGIGADPPTRNKLYPAMIAIGVENFSFELIEECSRDELNEKEQFWQEYFKAKEFGYSIK